MKNQNINLILSHFNVGKPFEANPKSVADKDILELIHVLKQYEKKMT
jgi:hypothetical protein